MQARALYRQVLGLPCWTSRALMSLAPRYGGPGCPHLPLRSACRLLLTYTQATCSRNLLAQHSAQYLSQASVPGSESQPLREAALQLSVQIALLPDATTAAMPVLYDSDPAVLQRYHHLVLSTDAALRQCDGGGGIVFYAPGVGVVLRAWYGIRLWASPTGAEWLVRLVALHLLLGWHGCLVSSADCSSALLRGCTRFPPKLTVLELLWRRLCLNLLGLRQHCEMWVPAQHDTQAQHLLALLNKEAHDLAARGASTPTPWAVPLPQHLQGALVLHYQGALLLEPQLGLDQAYEDATATAYYAGRRSRLWRPDGTVFYDLLESDALPTRAIKRAFAYRALEWQPPPEPGIPMECHFCGIAERQLWQHVRSRCPAAFLHLLHAQALLLSHVSPTPGATLTVDGVLQDVRRRPQLQCTWDAHFTEDAINCDTLTLSGLWYRSSSASPSGLTPAARHRATKAVVSTLALPPLSFADVYALWAALPCPHSPPDRPPPQPPAVTVQDPQVYVPWSYTLAASYLVRGLASWQVCSAGSLQMALPVEPSWHPGPPVLLIICPPAAECWALALLAEAEARPSWAGVALLTAMPPGDGALPLPAPMTPYACGPLWLYTTAGVAQRWALTPAAAPVH